MTYPATLLVHTANLETCEAFGVVDAWNVAAPTYIMVPIRCRFGRARATRFERARATMSQSDAGAQVDRKTACIVPAETEAHHGRHIIGTKPPYNRKYRITAVDPAMIANRVSHMVLTLEAVGV